jgi:Fe-S oxidoreductase
MARMKIEFLHHWHRKHRLSWTERAIASLPRWAPRAARVPWLANLRDALPGAAQASEAVAGLSSKRTLPQFRRDTFLRDATLPQDTDANVVLFVDTFTNYFEPQNARAALDVLRAAGCRIDVARPAADDGEPSRPLCCGRTFLASGLVDEAKREARRLLAALAPAVARGATIVGLEPSCLLGMRDEFLAMGFGEPASRVAQRALLIEEWLVSERRAGRLRLPLAHLPQKRALVHGHCHQKAFDVFAPTLDALALVPGLEVTAVESSCCGMAGSFGYEASHYDVSMRMAELTLLPAVRAAGRDTLIVADGTSCRHQIRDGTRDGGGCDAIHAIEVLARSARAARANPGDVR